MASMAPAAPGTPATPFTERHILPLRYAATTVAPCWPKVRQRQYVQISALSWGGVSGARGCNVGTGQVDAGAAGGAELHPVVGEPYCLSAGAVGYGDSLVVNRWRRVRPRRKDASVADDVLRLFQEFDDAELQADVERLQRLLADDFVSIGERGHVLDKKQWIARHGDFQLLSVYSTDVRVRHYNGAAILHGAQRVEATWRGEQLALNVQFSQVWVRQADDWRLASVQFSTLSTD